MRAAGYSVAAVLSATLALTPAAAGSQRLFAAYDPQWHGSGSLITFWNGSRLWLMNADGSARRQVVNNSDGSTSVSPDGRLVGEVDEDPTANRGFLFVSTLAGHTLRRLEFTVGTPEGFSAPEWTADGHAVAWDADAERGDQIFTSNLRNRVRLLSRRRWTRDRSPAWSPDGSRIAFVAYDNRLATMSADGTHRKALVPHAPEPQLGPGPVWSPDGRAIAFAYRHAQERTRARYSIYVIRADGSGFRRVAVTPPVEVLRSVAWSPAGDRLAWSDKRGVMCVHLTTGRKERLTFLNGASEYVSWAPSARLLFTAGGHVFTALPGHKPRQVF